MGMNKSVIDEFAGKVPQELLDIWSERGFCTMLDGYLRVIDPREYKDLLDETYFRGSISIPIFTTAFGDIITFEKNKYIGIVRYNKHDFNILAADFELFLMFLKDEYFLKSKFHIDNYKCAKEKLGIPKNDECFGYFPALCAGGAEKTENIKIVKIKEHILFLTQLAGRIE